MRDMTLFFSEKQAVTATANSTNTVYLGGGDVAHGLFFVAQVEDAFAGLTKVNIALETSDAETFTSAETVLTLPDYPVADLTAGAILAKVCLPLGMKKYARVKYTVTGTGTAGTISAFLMDNPAVGI